MREDILNNKLKENSYKERLMKGFKEVFANKDREALEWKKSGGKVAGCLGGDVPEELLIAGGLLPVRIYGSVKKNPILANQYLEQGFDPYIRAQFESIADGSYQYLDYLVISNSSDPIIRIYYYLRAMDQIEAVSKVPKLYFFDFLHTRFRTSALYNRERVKEFRSEIEKWIGTTINKEDLIKAIETCNENRFLLQQIRKKRISSTPRISGTEALQIIGSSMLMPKRKHNKLLRDLIQHIDHFQEKQGVKVFVTGSTHDHTEFYELVESCGAVIVGEDHDFGYRQYTGEINTQAGWIDGIVDRYHLRYQSASKATVSERVNSLIQQVKESNVQGVIFYIRRADDACLWDFPQQKQALHQMNIPVLLLDGQSYHLTQSDKDNIRTQVSDFIESILQKSKEEIKGGQK